MFLALASLVLLVVARRVQESWGPGLTFEPVDAVSGCLASRFVGWDPGCSRHSPAGGLIGRASAKARRHKVRSSGGACHPDKKEVAMAIVETRAVTGGVDTHLDVHVAAALDGIGGLLGVESFATTAAGYGELTDWLCSFGSVVRVGIEGTASTPVGLAAYPGHGWCRGGGSQPR